MFSVETSQYLPLMSYGASLDQISKMVFIPSKNISDLSFSKLPNNSASEIKPPGEIPKLNLPFNIWSIIATCPAI